MIELGVPFSDPIADGPTIQAAGQRALALDRTRKDVRNPLAVGFGIGTASQVAALSSSADGIIVGSALVKVIEQYQNSNSLVERVRDFIQELKEPLLC